MDSQRKTGGDIGSEPMRRGSGPARDWLLAACILAGAVAVRWTLDPWLGSKHPLVTLYAAAAACVAYCGLWPAVATSLGGYVICSRLFMGPGALVADDASERIGLLAYLVACAVIIGFGAAMRRAQQEELRGRELLRTTLASIGDAVVTTDAEGRVTYLNAVAESLTGWSRAEAQSQPLVSVLNIVEERSRKPAQNPAMRALREGTIVGLANHTMLIRKDGTEFLIDDSAAPIRDSRGSIIGCVLVFRDETERRRAQEAQHLLAAIVTDSEDAIISKSLDGRIRTWNKGAERLFGWREAEAVGKSIELIIPPERREEEVGILQRLRRGERIEHFETKRVRKDGRLIDVALTISPVKDADGEIVGASKVARDVTDRNRADEERSRLAAIITDSEDAIVSKSLDGRIKTWNRGAERVFGWTSEEAVGRSIEMIIPPERRDEERMIIARLRAGDRIEHFDTVRVTKDGRRVDVSLTISPVRDSSGTIVGASKVARDVTERKRVEESLRLADQRKDEFLATLAHELRNPLAPIRNSLEIMKTAGADAGIAEQARGTLDRQLSQMERLIDDLLDVSRITRNRLELRRERVELAAVLQQSVETSQPVARAFANELVLSLPGAPIELDADPVRLAQVFSNLLNNACKFSAPGERVEVRAERIDGEAVVTVEDRGIGIPSEMLPRIFEMFTQADRSLERSRGGLGIGLTLVKRLVEMHGGRVEAHSEGEGRGSRFVVRLPIPVPASAAPAATPAATPAGATPVAVAAHAGADVPAARGPSSARPGTRARARSDAPARRILVVDDNKDSAESLATLLRLSGHAAELAYDGLEALAAAERHRPEVVLLDIGLPHLNGYDACRRIRSEPWGKDMFIVALTGWGQAEDRRRSSEAGFDRHLVKPIDPAELVELLAQLPARA